MEPLKIDYSTLDPKVMENLPIFKLGRPNRKVSAHMGSGCFLDPPGYPSYFVRHVYDSFGNSPSEGPQAVIFWPEDNSYRVVEHYERNTEYPERKALLRAIYKPLPIDHPRTRAWIEHAYQHMHTCYRGEGLTRDPRDDSSLRFVTDPAEFLWPVPKWELRHYVDDARFSEEFRTQYKKEVEQFNTSKIERRRPYAVPENHRAVLLIRSVYPAYQPEFDLIERPPRYVGDWHERLNRRPTPEECATTNHLKVGGAIRAHNPERCQFCGHNW